MHLQATELVKRNRMKYTKTIPLQANLLSANAIKIHRTFSVFNWVRIFSLLGWLHADACPSLFSVIQRRNGEKNSLRLHFRSFVNVPSTFAAFWRSSLCSSMRVHNTMRCVACLPVVASCCAVHCTTAKSESVLWTSYPPVMRIRTYERAYAIGSHVWNSHARASIEKNFVHARMLNNLINAIEWIIIGIIVEAINWMSIMR